eukprot:GHRR01009063.1.p1 GENE.GHRR01009063.1~~GHRR01009063.1.p1  ORF type:complete len:159 (+),score=21.01 GHRR01009063.1:465-941(+)
MTQQDSGEGWYVELTDQPLDLIKCTQIVSDPGAGAISTFTGTTRNNFNGKTVVKLEYEAHGPMAVAKMRDVCKQAQSKWDVKHVAISHRLGPVAVSEASVVIAVSSAHRRAALEATHWAIDELKATVPIWKKEFFEDGSLWKENAESRPVDQPGPAQE